MQAYGDDNDFGASPEGSSEDDQNEQMDDIEDADADGDADADADVEMDGEEEDESENDIENENDDAFKEDDDQSQSNDRGSGAYFADPDSKGRVQGPNFGNDGPDSTTTHLGGPQLPIPTSHPRPPIYLTSSSPHRPSATADSAAFDHPTVRPEALTASVYDIVPTIAAPHSTSINAITATPDLRWVFSGGADGYIRRFNWVDTVNGKVMLTVAQRHPFVDSVTKAGVLSSYWENEEPQAKPSDDGSSLSSVYSLAVHNQGLWLLSGLESGHINLQSVRHDEGKRITSLKGHTSAVSALNLAQDEKSVLSGSWDKLALDWDLNTGQIKRSFIGSGGQISAIEMRPLSSLPVPESSDEKALTNGTFSSDSADKPRINGVSPPDGIAEVGRNFAKENGMANGPGSPTDSLFGGNDEDSLFGDNDEDNTGAPSGGNFGDDDDDEFSRAIANGMQQQENEEAEGDVSMIHTTNSTDAALGDGIFQVQDNSAAPDNMNGPARDSTNNERLPLTNGLPHGDYEEPAGSEAEAAASVTDELPVADSTFLAASFDGTIRVWDKRKSAPVAKINPGSAPPWCMSACWSPDGNFIYAGMRNGTVEEFSLHKGLRGVARTFKFPNGSGAVSAVRAMPNGRHLICASYDILRLYDLQQQQTFKHSSVPFLIVPGHRTGVVSQLYIDPTCRYMISTAGNRGWEGSSTEVLLGYEVNI